MLGIFRDKRPDYCHPAYKRGGLKGPKHKQFNTLLNDHLFPFAMLSSG